MSFEGRYQKICKQGHYIEEDVYTDSFKCLVCGSSYIEKNLIDDTNEVGIGKDFTMERRAEKIANESGIIVSFKVN